MTRSFLAACFAAPLAFAAPAALAQTATTCEMNRPIVFAGLDWDSNAFHTDVARFILEQGYGCKTDQIPGSTLPLLAGMIRGDIDVTMEIWRENYRDAWDKGAKDGKVAVLGVNFPDAIQGWYVPRYLVEGADAKAPELKAVQDLPKYKELFKDPEEPSKGRFYNCILGWSCEVTNTRKLEAYDLLKDYTNFRPGTGAALDAAIASNYERKRPFVAYYWGPTWVLGKYDLVMLNEPAWDAAKWAQLGDPKQKPVGVAYPTIEVEVGVNTAFQKQAPKLVEFLSKYRTSGSLTSKALAYMQANKGATTKDAALNFLKTEQDLWATWVPEDVAARLKTALSQG